MAFFPLTFPPGGGIGNPRQWIFLSYRRDDASDAAARIYDKLAHAFGAGAIFKDVDNIGPGADFAEVIATSLRQCKALLVIIGSSWISSRLRNTNDWVRIELETGFRMPGLRVIPVLTNGACMPRSEDLPATLQRLANLNAVEVRRDPDFIRDVERLASALRNLR